MKAKSKKSPPRKPPANQSQLKNLGNRIRQIRTAKGYTSYEYFAYEQGFSRTQFGRYEKGHDLHFTTLARIVKAFDMTLEEFFSEGFE